MSRETRDYNMLSILLYMLNWLDESMQQVKVDHLALFEVLREDRGERWKEKCLEKETTATDSVNNAVLNSIDLVM